MEEFELPVIYKGNEELIPCRLLIFGYSHRIIAMIAGNEITFEKDEEGNYRAIQYDGGATSEGVDRTLLQAIGNKLQASFG